MVDFQAVLLPNLLQDNVNPLDREDGSFLAYKNMAVHTSGLDMLVAVHDVCLQLIVHPDCTLLSCLPLNDGELGNVKNLRPRQSENVRDSQT